MWNEDYRAGYEGRGSPMYADSPTSHFWGQTDRARDQQRARDQDAAHLASLRQTLSPSTRGLSMASAPTYLRPSKLWLLLLLAVVAALHIFGAFSPKKTVGNNETQSKPQARHKQVNAKQQANNAVEKSPAPNHPK